MVASRRHLACSLNHADRQSTLGFCCVTYSVDWGGSVELSLQSQLTRWEACAAAPS
jgi:hypothetical protein